MTRHATRCTYAYTLCPAHASLWLETPCSLCSMLLCTALVGTCPMSMHAVQVPPMSAAQTRRVIERELGGVPMDEVFEWIDLEHPLGSASIAQAGPPPAPFCRLGSFMWGSSCLATSCAARPTCLVSPSREHSTFTKSSQNLV